MVAGLVSVIMSNFNTPEKYLRASIESVLEQTYKNFELIVVDDCSTDDSLKIIESYTDERIIVLKNEENLGITKSLNRALSVANGEFVARMDADDICMSDRFEKQVNYLSENPDTIVCGSAVEFIGDIADKQSVHLYRVIPDRETFQIYLLFANNPNIVHPSAMFNHTLLKKFGIKYNESYKYAQDYRMWVECSKFGDCANLSDVLLKYRIHSGAVSKDKEQEQRNCMIKILSEQLSNIGIELNKENLYLHENLLFGRQIYDKKYKTWIEFIVNQNKKYGYFNQKKIEKILAKKWVEITYFGLASNACFSDKLKMLCVLPMYNWLQLIEIFFDRKIKSKG